VESRNKNGLLEERALIASEKVILRVFLFAYRFDEKLVG
jgi:hypothetical protein